MFVPRLSETGSGIGKWFMMLVKGPAAPRRAGYCALDCSGHGTQLEAVEHHLQFQLDREVDLWLDRRATPRGCEICGELTTLRARLGHETSLFVLCRRHQSTSSIEVVFRDRALVAGEVSQPVAHG